MDDTGYDIFVELDALLDTRLATIAKINDEAAQRILDHTEYFDRLNDDFEKYTGIPRNISDDVYKRRDRHTLVREDGTANALLTPMVLQLNEIVKSILADGMVRHTPRKFKVIISTSPYTLPREDMDAIAAAIYRHIGEQVPVVCMDISLKDLVPSIIRSNYSGIILYHFNEWLSYHAKEICKTFFPRVTVLAPRLYCADIPDEATQAPKEFNGASAFAITKYGFALNFTLIFMHSSMYSAFAPAKLRHTLSEAAKTASESDEVEFMEGNEPTTPQSPPETS